jgi:hypothetical protein
VSPFLEDHKDGANDHCETNQIVPPEILFQVHNREDRENSERDRLLDGFQLRRSEFIGADAVCWDLKTILRESNLPTNDDDFEEWHLPVFQVPVPGNSHEDIRNR